VSQPLSLSDPGLRRAMLEALARVGELLILIRHTHGVREWWMVSDEVELERALSRVTIAFGCSDSVEAHATRELPYRGGELTWLREKALDVLSSSDVVLACMRDGDPELHDVVETDEIEEVDEWLGEQHDGQLMVGPHPLPTRNDFYPDVEHAFLAYAPLPDGTVRPGAY
jgi:hypothetical protein